MKSQPKIAIPMLLFLTACQSEPADEPVEQIADDQITQVIVTECYNSGGELSIEINGRPLLLTPVGQRDDTTGMCFWDGIVLPNSFSISSGEQSVSLRRDEGKSLMIPATNPSAARFVDAAEVKLD